MTGVAKKLDMLDKNHRILILGGTGEARQLATQAVRMLPKNVEIISSYAGRTRRIQEPTGTIREGGFGGVKGLEQFIYAEAIDMLVDATHPFATAISHNAALAAGATGIPRLFLKRQGWTLPGDLQVTEASNMTEAARLLNYRTTRVFLSTGSKELEAFTTLDKIWFLIRLINEPKVPLPIKRYKLLIARPPFQKDEEISLFLNNGIETLVSKDSGGSLPGKIFAAAALNIPVILIRQPDPPEGHQTNEISSALIWIRERL